MKVAIIEINSHVKEKEIYSIAKPKKSNEKLSISFFSNSDKKIFFIEKKYKKHKNFNILINDLVDYLKSLNFKYTFLLFSNSYMLSLKNYFLLLEEFINSKKILGIRLSQANAQHLFFDSLRSPYVDTHFVIINNDLFIKDNNIITNNLKINNHIKFFQYIEKNYKADQIFNFYSGLLLNQYGEESNNYYPFSLCTKYGLITSYPLFDFRLNRLLKFNLDLKKNFFLKKYYYKKSNNFFFIRRLKINYRFFSNMFFNNNNVVTLETRKKTYKNLDDDRFV
ncbi:hypothetical protein OAI94_00350 [bacterium]|nr:hypothetical protein [bacterium]